MQTTERQNKNRSSAVMGVAMWAAAEQNQLLYVLRRFTSLVNASVRIELSLREI